MPRTIAKDYDDKRRQILSCAAKLFADEGFDGASVNSIAKACNISKANIYHYYKSKDDILFDILDKYLSELRDRICGIELKKHSAEESLRITITEILLAYQGADNEHRLQSESVKHLPNEKQNILLGYQRELVKHTANLVQAITPKIIENDKAKIRAATMSLFGMLNWFYMWNSDADENARKEYADLVCQICIRGMPSI